jgi:hypothetical protein
MSSDYDVVLIRKDGSVRNFRIFGEPSPHAGEVISLPVDGRIVKAQIGASPQESTASQSVDAARAVEV